jgi:predicted extracellular nuclease
VRDRLGTPDLLALEEVENTRVLDDLLARPELAGLGYQYVLLPTSGRRSINPALLYRAGSASVLDARQAQKAIRGGEESIYADPATHPTARASKAPLFAREPLIVDLKLTGAGAGQELTLVVNHLVSKFSPHGVPTDTTRVEQAEFLRDTVNQLRTDHPEREVVVLGDMNDTPDSRSLKALTGTKRAPTLINTTATLVPEAERYSFLYEGRSELIDHILVTPGLQAQVDRTGVRHGNADLPIGDAWDSSPQRASDHDSPYLWLRLGEQPATPKPQPKP